MSKTLSYTLQNLQKYARENREGFLGLPCVETRRNGISRTEDGITYRLIQDAPFCKGNQIRAEAVIPGKLDVHLLISEDGTAGYETPSFSFYNAPPSLKADIHNIIMRQRDESDTRNPRGMQTDTYHRYFMGNTKKKHPTEYSHISLSTLKSNGHPEWLSLSSHQPRRGPPNDKTVREQLPHEDYFLDIYAQIVREISDHLGPLEPIPAKAPAAKPAARPFWARLTRRAAQPA